jgi:glycosyltransferase involved in cell wall biosynthesis
MDKMKIALLQPSLTWRGGAERQVLNLAVELQRAGHKVEIFTCAASDNCYPELLNQLVVNVVKAPIRGKRSSSHAQGPISKNPQVARKRGIARRVIGSFRNYYYGLPAMLNLGMKIPRGFDVINNHNCPTEWAAFFAKKRLNAPVVWMCNEPPFWFTDVTQRKGLGKVNLPLYEGLDRVAVDYVDRIVVLSAIAGQRVEQAYQKPCKIVHTGVNIDLFHKASGKELRARYGLEKDFVLLQVGNIAPDKRQTDSIHALHKVSKKHPNIKLIFDGEGPKEHLLALSRQLGIKDKVIFLHSPSDTELAQLYAACDVFLFPSQITWGLAVIEAMTASKPVLVSNKSGASEVISNGENGFVIQEPYPENMALHIENLIANQDLRRKIGENAYEYARQNLSWEMFAKNMASVFQDAVAGYRNPR